MAILRRLVSRSKSGKGNDSERERLLIDGEAEAEGPDEKRKSRRNPEKDAFGRRRMLNELRRMGDYQESHCSYWIANASVNEKPFKFRGIIIGPSDTPFEGGIFFLSINLTTDYPFRPPRVRFLTKVFHPNVTSDGRILVDILSYNWSPALTIQKLLLSICSFLPNPSHDKDGCNPVCDLYWKHRDRYEAIAREWTLKYAMH